MRQERKPLKDHRNLVAEILAILRRQEIVHLSSNQNAACGWFDEPVDMPEKGRFAGST